MIMSKLPVSYKYKKQNNENITDVKKLGIC